MQKDNCLFCSKFGKNQKKINDKRGRHGSRHKKATATDYAAAALAIYKDIM